MILHKNQEFGMEELGVNKIFFGLIKYGFQLTPKLVGTMRRRLGRQTLIYEKDRFRKVINDSLEYILEVKYNYKYDPKKEVKLLKNYSEKGGYKIDIQDFEWSKLDSLVKWITL